MERSEKERLSDTELDVLLKEWTAPAAPTGLRASLFPDSSRPWWLRMWRASVPIPAPVAVCLVVAIVFAAWRLSLPVPSQVVVKTERVEIPVVRERVVTKTVYRDRIVQPSGAASGQAFGGLLPVAELRPRIIRRGDAQN